MSWTFNLSSTDYTFQLWEREPVSEARKQVEIIPPRIGSTYHIIQELYTVSPPIITRAWQFFSDYSTARSQQDAILGEIGTRGTLTDVDKSRTYNNIILASAIPRIMDKPISYGGTQYSVQTEWQLTVIADSP